MCSTLYGSISYSAYVPHFFTSDRALYITAGQIYLATTMLDVELEEINVPFLSKSGSSSPSLGPQPDLLRYASIPASEAYTAEFEGEVLEVESQDWRTSNLLRVQIVLCFLNFVVFGLGDQTIGTIIPKLQAHYKIDDLHIGFIFLALTSGYFTMALLSEICHRRLGVRGVGIMGLTCMTLGFLVGSTEPPYIVFVMCYALIGIGCGILDSSINGWMGDLVDSNQLLGILHGGYGVGCMISPPLVTRLIEKNNWAWSQYYIVLSCISASGMIFFTVVFRNETPLMYKFSVLIKEIKRNDETDGGMVSATLGQALKSRLVWLFSIVMFFYVGAEVAFGAWLVTFLTRIRKFPYRFSSYMATAFWTGLTLGRICLGFVTAHYFNSELAANLVYILLSLASYVLFTMFAFSAKNLLFPIVLVAGLFVGPIFPTTIVASIEILPAKFHATGVGFICAFGGGGSAVLPFVIGLVAERTSGGLAHYPIIITAIYVMLSAAWLGLVWMHAGHQRRER